MGQAEHREFAARNNSQGCEVRTGFRSDPGDTKIYIYMLLHMSWCFVRVSITERRRALFGRVLANIRGNAWVRPCSLKKTVITCHIVVFLVRARNRNAYHAISIIVLLLYTIIVPVRGYTTPRVRQPKEGGGVSLFT